MVYVYGVLAASDADGVSVAGVKSAGVRTLRHGELAALISALEQQELVAAEEVRAHWRVLDEVSAQRTVLPVRFGTVMESESAVREQLLEPHGERLAGLLRELRGSVQLNVKGDYDEDALMRDVVQRSPAVAALRERLRSIPGDAGYYDRIRLGELVAAEVERHREQDRDLALAKLEPLATSARAEQVGGAEAAFNLAFLVERDKVGAFSATVRELDGELGDRILLRYIGPLPPYSFADTDLATGETAWA